MAMRYWIFVAALLPATQALAHTHLVSSSPADGAVLVAGAKELTLIFDGLIAEATCTSDAAGLGVAKPEREKVHVPVTAALPAGAYALACRYKGVDGHEMNATVKFSVAK